MNHPHFKGHDILSALAVIVIWGLNFVAIKLSLREFTPFQLGFFRYVFAVVPLVFLVKRPAVGWRWIAWAGMAQFGQFALLFVALQVGMTAALSSVLMQTQMFFTTLLGVIILHERMTPEMRFALVLAAVGLAFFASDLVLNSEHRDVTWLGLVLNLGSALMWAGGNIVTRQAQHRQPGYDALGFITWMSLMPIVPFAVLAFTVEPVAGRWQWMHAGLTAWLGVAYLGWFATIVAYSLWTRLLKRFDASRVAPFSLGVPVVGLLAGMTMLGERLSIEQWAGSALVVSALMVNLWAARRRQARRI